MRLDAVYEETKQDNDVANLIGTIYAKNETELLWPIGLGVVCDENETWPII